jgi:carboxymethylenebutenolidase
MSDNPHVLMGPIAAGGRGRDGVYKSYRDLFLAQIPADIKPVLISQVIGKDILAEEAVYQFTHNRIMDWLIPGILPTGKRVEVGVVALIKFENGKIATEHVYWDHSIVLAQLGVIDRAKGVAKGVESPRTLLEWAGIKPAHTHNNLDKNSTFKRARLTPISRSIEHAK